MKLRFDVEVELDVPDELVQQKLRDMNEDSNNIDALTIGDFLHVTQTPPTAPGVTVLGFTTGEFVEHVKD